MSQSNDEIRALRVMVEELRAEEPPELGWDTIERRLFTRIDAAEAARRTRVVPKEAPRSQLWHVFGFAAAAAAIVLGVGSMAGTGQLASAPSPVGRAIDPTTVALAAGEADAHELLDLRRGDVVEAGATPVVFGHAGVATWTLAPHGRVRVLEMGKAGVGHTVALERGSLRAEVTPRAPSEGLVEAFAVEIGGTRVAVHGTAFSVAREDDGLTVDVEHGAVAVGPVGHVGTTTGRLLVGPARASFSLNGGRSARILPRPEPVAPVAVAASAPAEVPASDAPAAAAPEHEPANSIAPPPRAGQAPHPAALPVPDGPSEPEPAPKVAALTPELVRARLGSCIQKTFDATSSSVRVSVSSTLRLEVNADGSVRSARFDPPIKPELQTCASAVYAGRFSEGARRIDIPVNVAP